MNKFGCPCNGSGWVKNKSNYGQCAVHFEGQLEPMTRDLLLDEPEKLKDEERKSYLHWAIAEKSAEILSLQADMDKLIHERFALDLELINKTPTIKMGAVTSNDLVEEIPA